MARNILDKVGAAGAVNAGATVPCCFPFLGLFRPILGLSIFARYVEWILYIIQILVLVALVGGFIAYRGHRKPAPLILSFLSPAAIIHGINSMLDTYYTYDGLIALLIVSASNSFEVRRCAEACGA